jgi:hypothetical protein
MLEDSCGIYILLLPVNTQSLLKWMMAGPCGANGLFAYKLSAALIGYGASVCVDSGHGQNRYFYYVLFTAVSINCPNARSRPTLYFYRIFTNALLFAIPKHSMNLWKREYYHIYVFACQNIFVFLKGVIFFLGVIYEQISCCQKHCQFHYKASIQTSFTDLNFHKLHLFWGMMHSGCYWLCHYLTAWHA